MCEGSKGYEQHLLLWNLSNKSNFTMNIIEMKMCKW